MTSRQWLVMVLALHILATGGASMSANGATKAGRTNRLIKSNSPYLLQHAHNPVDWYPWGDEAIDKARHEDKPIFLSIGYSACHWCHVMAHESFENEQIAAILNEHFVSIKVDREERPDIDEIYMQAIQMMTGSGGWPLSAWLTPDLKPFFGGTYFPPDDRFGRPGFERVLTQLAELWKTDRAKIDESAVQMYGAMQKALSPEVAADLRLESAAANARGLDALARDAVSSAVKTFVSNLDAKRGGFGRAPKFPPSGIIRLLLRAYHRHGDVDALKAATTTLDRMAYGGLFDQIGGGFHRYSVDDVWLVPHFEKMLYDNAQLAVAYTEAFQITEDPLYKRIATQTLDYVLREMTDAGGGFHAAEDADSEGEEGKYYVWSVDEVEQVLGKKDGAFFSRHYAMSTRGNFEGHNILHIADSKHEDKMLSAEDRSRLDTLNQTLRKHRDGRIHPGRDDKVLMAWNGLMVTAFVKGYQAFGNVAYRAAALRGGEFLLNTLVREGRILRSYRNGVAEIDGFLDDYAALANACLDVYEISFDWSWVTEAEKTLDALDRQFKSASGAAYHYTAAGQTDLLARTTPLMDSQIPSGNTLAAAAFLRLSRLLGNEDYRTRSEALLRAGLPLAIRHPRAVTHLLVVLDMYSAPQTELVLVGPSDDADLKEFRDMAYRQFAPAPILVQHDPSDSAPPTPLLEGRGMVDGKATAYLCRDSFCKKPMTCPDEFATVLHDEFSANRK